MKRRILTILLCCILVIPFVACQSGSRQPDSSSSQAPPSSSAPAGSAAEAPAAREPVEISIMIYDRGEIRNDRPTYDSMFTDYFSEQMQELYNVSLSFVPVPRSEDTSTLNVLLASREAPDMIYSYDDKAFFSWAQMGALQDLAPALEQHGPNVSAFLDSRPGLREQGYYQDTLYAIRGGSLDVYRGSWTYIRNDWLETLGLEAPTTADEMLDVLRAFKNGEEALGVTGIVPLGMAVGGATGCSYNHNAIMSAFGLPHDYDVVDGKVYPVAANPNYRDYLFFLNTCYREGLIYSEFVTDTDSSKVIEQKEKNQIGVWTGNLAQIGGSANGLNDTETAQSYNTEFVYLDALLDSSGRQHKIVDPHPGFYLMAPEYSPHVNEVMMYWDWSASDGFPTQYYGFEGIHFNWDDNHQPVFITEARERDGYNWGDQSPIRTAEKDALYFQAAMPNQKLADIATYAYEMFPVNARLPLLTFYETLPAQDTYTVILDDLTLQGAANIITADDPQTAYDQFITEYMASGGQQLIDELTEYYEKMK